MDYERFKEDFQDALKAELAVRGADVELTARRVDKMNESYDAITVRPRGETRTRCFPEQTRIGAELGFPRRVSLSRIYRRSIWTIL